jgi:hypothetical protein
MSTIVLRTTKGSALTNTEVDNNFSNLNTDKVEKSGSSMTGNLSFADNAKAIFGAGSDLQIYHDGGTNQFISNGPNMRFGTTGEDFITLTNNGAVTLYNNNASKLATTSTGIDVTGLTDTDTLSVTGNTTVGTASGSESIGKPGTDTATGLLRIQAGAISSAYGGGLILFSHSNASTPGWVMAGLSQGAAAKFAVNTWGTGGGTNVFTVDPTGLGYFAGNVAINTTSAAWTNASALLVSNYAAYGQRNVGTADGVVSWNAQWSGSDSGAGYTYRVTGDVASAYEQNGGHRFYTTSTAGTAGVAISMLERFAIQNSGIVQSYVSTIVGVTTTGGMGAQTGLTVVGGVDVNDNSPGVLTLGSHGNARPVGSVLGKIDFYSNDASGGASGVQASIRGVTLGSIGDSAGLYFYTGTPSTLGVAGAVNDSGQWVFGGATATGDSNAKLTLYTSSTAIGLTIYEQSTGNNARLRLSQNAGAVIYDATYSSGGNSHVFQIGSGTVATINGSGNLLFGTASNYNTIGMPEASGGYGISWGRYGNIFGEYSSGATYISSNYYPTTGAAGYKTTNTATYGAAGISVNGTGGTSNGGLIAFLVDPPTSKTAGNAFIPSEVARITATGLSIGTSATEGKLTVANGNEASGQVQIAQFRTEATGSTTYNAGVQIYGTASANAASRLVSIVLDPDGANAAGGDYVGLAKYGNNGDAQLYNASNADFYFGVNLSNNFKLSGANTLNLQGRKSNAYSIGNVQEWAGTVGVIANGASFSLFAINNIYDMLCYDLNIFANTGGFFSYKSAGVFGYNGFTNTVLGTNITLTITKTGTLYNETMTITNNSGGAVNEWVISLRVWGYGAAQSVSTGGADLVTTSYLIRQT